MGRDGNVPGPGTDGYVSPLFGSTPPNPNEPEDDGTAEGPIERADREYRKQHPNTGLEPDIDTHGATFSGKATVPPDVIPITGDSSTPETAPVPSRLIPAVVAVLVVLAIVGVAVARSNSGPAPAPAFTLPPPPTSRTAGPATPAPGVAASPRVAQLTFSTPADGTSVCLQAVNFTLSVTLENAKAGDTVHVALSGSGMPTAGVTGTVDASLTFKTTVGPVGPVKGRNVWEATVDTINGQPTAGIRATSLALCPN